MSSSGVAQVVAITPTLDNAVAYTAGDILFDTTAIAGATRYGDGAAVLQSLVINDKDDQAAATLDLYILNANNSFGTRNSAPSITDANADAIIGRVSIAVADWTDLGGCKIAVKTGINMVIKPATNTTTLYVAAITGGTPTTTTAGMTLRFGFTQD